MRGAGAGLLLVLLLAGGCVSLGSRKSSFAFKDADGKPVGEVDAICQSDGRCRYQDAKVTVEVDNRGPLGQVWAAGTASLGKIYETVKEAAK